MPTAVHAFGSGSGGGVRTVKVLPPEAKGIVYVPLDYFDATLRRIIHQGYYKAVDAQWEPLTKNRVVDRLPLPVYEGQIVVVREDYSDLPPDSRIGLKTAEATVPEDSLDIVDVVGATVGASVEIIELPLSLGAIQSPGVLEIGTYHRRVAGGNTTFVIVSEEIRNALGGNIDLYVDGQDPVDIDAFEDLVQAAASDDPYGRYAIRSTQNYNELFRNAAWFSIYTRSGAARYLSSSGRLVARQPVEVTAGYYRVEGGQWVGLGGGSGSGFTAGILLNKAGGTAADAKLGVDIGIAVEDAGADWGFITRQRTHQHTPASTRISETGASPATLDVNLPETMVRPTEGNANWVLRMVKNQPGREPLFPAAPAVVRLYTHALQDRGIQLVSSVPGPSGNGKQFDVALGAIGTQAEYNVGGQLIRLRLDSRSTTPVSQVKNIFDVGQPPGRQIGGIRFFAEYFGGEDGTGDFNGLSLAQVLGASFASTVSQTTVSTAGGAPAGPAVAAVPAEVTYSPAPGTSSLTVQLSAPIAEGSLGNAFQLQIGQSSGATRIVVLSNRITIEANADASYAQIAASVNAVQGLTATVAGVGTAGFNRQADSFQFAGGEDAIAATPRTVPFSAALDQSNERIVVQFVATDTLRTLSDGIKAIQYPSRLGLGKLDAYRELDDADVTVGQFNEAGLVVESGSGFDDVELGDCANLGATLALDQHFDFRFSGGVDRERLEMIFDVAAKTGTLIYHAPEDPCGDIAEGVNNNPAATAVLAYGTAPADTAVATPLVCPFESRRGAPGLRGRSGDDAVPAGLSFADIQGQIEDRQVPDSFTRDTELTADFIRGILGLTAQEINDVFVGAVVSGAGAARILTITQADGSTLVLPIPDTTGGGGGGSADGVVASGAFNSDSTTLTLTLSTGGTVAISVPALLRGAGFRGAYPATAANDAELRTITGAFPTYNGVTYDVVLVHFTADFTSNDLGVDVVTGDRAIIWRGSPPQGGGVSTVTMFLPIAPRGGGSGTAQTNPIRAGWSADTAISDAELSATSNSMTVRLAAASGFQYLAFWRSDADGGDPSEVHLAGGGNSRNLFGAAADRTIGGVAGKLIVSVNRQNADLLGGERARLA